MASKKTTSNNSLRDYLRQNSITITIQVVGALVLVLNLWLASKLSPLAEDIRLLKFQVQAVERTVTESQDKIHNIDILQTQISNIDTNIKEIKETVLRLDNRIDLVR